MRTDYTFFKICAAIYFSIALLSIIIGTIYIIWEEIKSKINK